MGWSFFQISSVIICLIGASSISRNEEGIQIRVQIKIHQQDLIGKENSINTHVHPIKSLRLTDSHTPPKKSVMNSSEEWNWWWQALMAVPADPNSHEYERLKRVWFDHTWNGHPFLNPAHENHLTATLFENFTLFPAASWIPKILSTSDFEVESEIIDCRWGYEVLDARTNRLADIAIHCRTSVEDFVIIVEAKRKRGTLKQSDLDSANYLDAEEFKWAEKRHLVYLCDESDLAVLTSKIQGTSGRSSALTWQQLGGIQIQEAAQLELPQKIRAFIAGAIQHQFCNHGFIPDQLSASYLGNQPHRDDIRSSNPLKMRSFRTSWRLDCR